MIALTKYILKAAFTDKLILSFFIIVVLSYALSVFLGGSAITEKDQFVLVFLSGSLRLITVITITLFTVFFIRRSFETKDIEFLLTRPIRRIELVLSFAFAFSLLALTLAVIASFVIFLVSAKGLDSGILLWCLSVVVEAVIMANVSIFFAFVISSSVNALLVIFGFYILSRLIGQILGIISSGISNSHESIEFIMQIVSILTPRFDLLGQTSWIIYGFENSTIGFAYVVLHGCIFTGLLLSATLFDFMRRQF